MHLIQPNFHPKKLEERVAHDLCHQNMAKENLEDPIASKSLGLSQESKSDNLKEMPIRSTIVLIHKELKVLVSQRVEDQIRLQITMR